jgi:hypothetical protein
VSDNPAGLDAAEAALRSLRNQQQINEAEFFRGLVKVAYGWIGLGNKEQACSLLGNLTHEYVDVILPLQMIEDPNFAAQAAAVGAATRGEMDDSEAEIDFVMLTKKPAEA